jgi:hypothetical protein
VTTTHGAVRTTSGRAGVHARFLRPVMTQSIPSPFLPRCALALCALLLGCAPSAESFDAGAVNDAGERDAGALDSGARDSGVDAGADAGHDAGLADAGATDAGRDAGRLDAGQDAGAIDGGIDAGFSFDAGSFDGGIAAIRFGLTAGGDGLFAPNPVDPNSRTVSAWLRLRASTVSLNRQLCAWSIEDDPPSSAYHLMITTFQTDAWEAHDRTQGGFLFAPVDLGWWFVAESHLLGGTTRLYWKKEGAATLSVASGNTHPSLSGMTRFLVGTDDATGQNEWMDGAIADVKVWSTALSQAELEQEALHLAPVRTSNLYAWYPLQSLGTMLTDFSGNGHHLTPITPATGNWALQSGPAISP